jgi:ribonuclease HI
MSFKEMQFKGKRVFVEIDETGSVIVDKGRAKMKYKLDDDKIYSPGVLNLSEVNSTEAASKIYQSTAVAGAPKKTKTGGASPEKKVTLLPEDADAVIAFTDGACSGNPGPAGLGYFIRFPDGRRIEKGEPLGNGTNNIAELTAILRVLENVEDVHARIIIHTDSSYSIGVLTAGWKAKANQTLIATIKSALRKFSAVELRKVKGHAGIEENEIVDRLARESAEQQKIV